MEEINHAIVLDLKETMQENFTTMVQYFMEDSIAHMNDIKEGIKEKNADKIILPAHTIKSSAKLLGAEIVSESAKEIEFFAKAVVEGKEFNIDTIQPLFVRLQESYAAAEQKLKALI